MTPTDFAQFAKAWPSVSALAADLATDRTTVWRYIRGKRAVPGPVARLVRLLHDNPGLRT